jgi:GSH-dependent disulfide-bond oxidoreductase
MLESHEPTHGVISLYSWGTPNGNKIHIMLEELAVPYRLIPVDIGHGEQHDPAFRAISPNGKIPAIVDQDGPGGRTVSLAESGAILIYLAEKYGRFLPADPLDRLSALQWIMFQMGHIGPMIGQLHHFQSTAPAGNEYSIERYRKEGQRLLTVLDERLARSPYLAGGDYSIADMCTWPWLRSWIHTTRQELGKRPALQRWFDQIGERPAVKAAVRIQAELRELAAART